MKGLVILATVLGGAGLPGAAAAKDSNPPDVRLYDLGGALVDTARIRAAGDAKLLALDFFSVDCPSCKAQLPAWSEAHARMAAAGLRIALVAVPLGDDRDAALDRTRRYFREHPVPFPVLWDKYAVAAKAYGVADGTSARLPQAFLIDRDGRQVAHSDGHEGTLDEAARLLAPK